MYESSTWIRVGGVCGIIFVILVLVMVFAGGGPPPAVDASGKDVAAHFAGGRAKVAYGAAVMAAPFVPWFFTTLTLVLWTRTRDRAYAATGLVAITLNWAILTAGLVIVRSALVYGQLDESTAHAFNVASYHESDGAVIAGAAAILAYGIVQARMAGLWRWVGYLAFLVALLDAITFLTSVSNGPAKSVGLFGFIAFLLWVLLTAILQIWQGPGVARNQLSATQT
jgi:hypothetical protein